MIPNTKQQISKKRLAIVPARGGSKRILKKNIRNFHGRPIILRTLQVINESNLFDEIHVSTEDAQIRRVVSEAGFTPRFGRDDSLSGDEVAISQVVDFVLKTYNFNSCRFDTIGLIFPTAVFLTVPTLVRAIEYFETLQPGSELLSVSKFPVPIEWALKKNAQGSLVPSDPKKIKYRSQDLQTKFYETGQFVLYDNLSAHSGFADRYLYGFEQKDYTIDIDNESDWKLAEQYYAFLKFSQGEIKDA